MSGMDPLFFRNIRLIQLLKSKKNPNYWDAETVSLEAIRFYPIESADTEERAFRSGFLHHLTQTVSQIGLIFLNKSILN